MFILKYINTKINKFYYYEICYSLKLNKSCIAKTISFVNDF